MPHIWSNGRRHVAGWRILGGRVPKSPQALLACLSVGLSICWVEYLEINEKVFLDDTIVVITDHEEAIFFMVCEPLKIINSQLIARTEVNNFLYGHRVVYRVD